MSLLDFFQDYWWCFIIDDIFLDNKLVDLYYMVFEIYLCYMFSFLEYFQFEKFYFLLKNYLIML